MSPPSIVQEGIKEWGEHVGSCFVDKWLSFNAVKNHLIKVWKTSAQYDITTDTELFQFKFFDKPHRRKVLDSGPLFVSGRVFVLQQWFPEVEDLN